MTITIHPARMQTRRTIWLTLFLLLCSAGGTAWIAPVLSLPSHAVWDGAIMAIIFAGMVLSLARWYFPTSYQMDTDEICIRFLGSARTYRWERFRSFRTERGGLYLSPFSDAARFANWRGLFLPLDKSVVSAARGSQPLPPDSVPATLAAFVEERLIADRQDR